MGVAGWLAVVVKAAQSKAGQFVRRVLALRSAIELRRRTDEKNADIDVSGDSGVA